MKNIGSSSSSWTSLLIFLLPQILPVVSSTSFITSAKMMKQGKSSHLLTGTRNMATIKKRKTVATTSSLKLFDNDNEHNIENVNNPTDSKWSSSFEQNGRIKNSNKNQSRRSVLFNTMTSAAASAAALSTLHPTPSFAASPPPPPLSPPMVLPKNAMLDSTSDMSNNGLIESRVTENVLSPPPYGLEDSDIYYPSYFQGVWSVNSITTSIQAPCGVQLFGGNSTYTSALQTIGPKYALNYKCRFVPSKDGSKPTTIADREYNVREIAKAAMGPNSVVDIPVATPNKLSCLLSPMGSSSMMVADILTLARRQENVNDAKKMFDCAEVVRQIVSPLDSYKTSSTGFSPPPPSSGGRTTLLKEIETASLYVATPPSVTGGDVTEIHCRQRSATFLLPSQTDPIAYQLWQMSRGRPIDVRFFDVVYTKQV